VCDIIAAELDGLGAEIKCCPLADGGEDSQHVLLDCPERIANGVYIDRASNVACVVTSEIVGRTAVDMTIALMQRSSRQLGQAILLAASAQPDKILVAIGGTATSDAGAGMLAALGAKFIDKQGHDISDGICPNKLINVERLDLGGLAQLPEIVAIADVHAALADGQLSAVDFARQKTSDSEDLTRLRPALEHIQQVVGACSPFDGAGGGIGFALCSVMGAKGCSGAQYAIQRAAFDWADIDLVITGEGKLDEQTSRGGKLAHEMHEAAKRHGVECMIIAGQVAMKNPPYSHVFSTTDSHGSTYADKLAAATRRAIPLISKLLKLSSKNN
jgi:glycerate kinase